MKVLSMLVGLWLWTAFFPLSAQSTLNITGAGFSDYSAVILKALDAESLEYEPVDTQEVEANQAFQFQVPFQGANLYQLDFQGKEKLLLSVVSGGEITVKRNAGATVIEGSPSSVSMQSFRSENEQLQARHFGRLKAEMDQAMAANDEAKLQEIQQRSAVAVQAFLKEFRAQIEALGVNPAGYYALQFSDFTKELAFIETRLSVFQEVLPDSPVTRALARQVYQAKTTAIGRTPPGFEANDQHGQPVDLESLRGKWVLLDFWAAWCRACRVENPELAKVYDTYRQRDFMIVSISQDKTRRQWEQAIEKDGIGAWPQVWDQDGRISALYSVSSLPQNLLLDQSGAIIAKNLTAAQLREILEGMIN